MVTPRFIFELVLVAAGANAIVQHKWITLDEAGFNSTSAEGIQNLATMFARDSTSSGPNFAFWSTFAVTLTYFLNYFLLACVHSKNQYYYPSALPSPNERILENCATYLVYVAPMLCVLFFEVVKRFDLPPLWLNCAIVVCSVAFCLQALAYIVSELYFKQVDSSIRSADQHRVVLMVRFWRNFCNTATMVQYISVACIIGFGIGLGSTPLLLGHKCTFILAAIYMVVYLLLFVLRTNRSDASAYYIEILKHASLSINFAPMLCVVCMGTQMAYEMGGLVLTPDVSSWMLIATCSVIVQVLLVPLAPILAGAELRVVGPNGEVDFVSRNQWIFILFSFLRWIAMVVMFVGVCLLCNALWAANPPKALRVSLYYFSLVYFATFLALWFVISVDGVCYWATRVLKMAKDAVAFCPMLCVLFLSVFLEASKFGATATPESYSQDWMIVGTAALLTQIVIICLAGYMDKTYGLGALLLLLFYIAMFIVFVSVAIVAIGAFLINEGNASVDGAWFAQ